MRNFGISITPSARKPIPRGIAASGPAVLSYGFRPFFLCAGLYAPLAMALWIGALSGLWSVGGVEGEVAWHAHEMLFGYTAAALAGFVLTAVPNWTGRLPVSGRPLAALVGLWLVGRLVDIDPALLGDVPSAALDMLFLPALAFVVVREVVVGRNWQNVRVGAGITLLALLNLLFHVFALKGWDVDAVLRGTVALYVVLVSHIGGRLAPSFTRNYLAKRNARKLPRPAGRLDQVAFFVTIAAGALWAIHPEGWTTAVLCAAAALCQLVRLAGWRGLSTYREPLLAVLHLAYCFVPFGFLAAGAAAIGLISEPSALHVLTIGVIGLATMAVMTRATRGHTGRPLTASVPTTLSYAALLLAALARPLAEALPEHYHPILMVAGSAWIAAFVLFLVEHAPMLWGRNEHSNPRPKAV